MCPNTASYIAVHPGLIKMTKKLSYSQTGKLESPDFIVGWFLHPNPDEIYSNFLVILHYFMYPYQASYIAVHPGLIRMTKKLSYSETEKLGSPDFKVG